MKNLKEIKGRKYILTMMVSIMLCCITVFASSTVTYEEEKESQINNVQNELTDLSAQIVALTTQVEELKIELSGIQELNNKTYIVQTPAKAFIEENAQSKLLGTFNVGSAIKANIVSEDGLWIETDQGYVETKNLKQLDTVRNENNFVIYEEKVETAEEKEPVKEEVKPITYNLSVKGKSGLTKEDLDYILAGTPMKDCADEMLLIEEKYNVNAFFTSAVAQAETQRGLTGTGKSKNNAFGITSKSGGYRTFNSLGDSVIEFGGMIDRVYFSRGLTTVKQVHSLYTSSPNWSSNVSSIMKSTLAKIKQK